MLRKLSFIGALVIACAIPAAGCREPTSQDTPARPSTQTIGDPSKLDPDEPKLIPTDDPNVFKVTKPLPRPAEAANYPKPEYPQLGYESSFEGAEKVAIYLEDLITYAYSTGDYQDLDDLCAQTSDWCMKRIKGIKALKNTTDWYSFEKSPEVTVTGYGVPPKEQNNGQVSIRIETRIWEYSYFDSTEMKLAKSPSTRLLRHVNLSYVDGKWIIVAVNSKEIK